jgi:hypothetical protein
MMLETIKAKPGFDLYLMNDGYMASLEWHKIYRVLLDPEAE